MRTQHTTELYGFLEILIYNISKLVVDQLGI